MKHQTCAAARVVFAHVLIVDDHPLYRDALASAVQGMFEDAQIETAGTLHAAMEKLERGFKPDLVLFDLKLPDVAGISGFVNLRKRIPDCPIVVISSLASHEVVHALMDEGAAGFMPKDHSAKDVQTMLQDIMDGQKFLPRDFRQSEPRAVTTSALPEDLRNRLEALTVQQKRVLRLICAGKPNKQIAFELDLAEATVKAHITVLLRRLGVKNRTQAAVLLEAMHGAGNSAQPEVSAFLAK